MAAVEVKVPDIGDFDDVPVIEILVEPGQTVQEEDPLVTLESDKATMDVPSPSDGVIGELKVAIGDAVSEGSVILMLEPPGGSGDGAAPEPEPEPESAPEQAAQAEPVKKPAKAQPAAPATEVYASPAVRRAAREQGVDLAGVAGTGRNGRITLEDLESGGAPAPAPAQAAPEAPAPQAGDEDERVELTRIQRISGPRLQQAWQTIPHVTQFDEADITELESFRKQTNAEQSDVKVTMVALVMKACVASLRAHPVVNSQLDGEDGLILKRAVNLGFAADTPQGLVVPVIKDVDSKGLLQV
ncbi:MAG: hypothetical protein QOE86_3456, partial [Solirubrobacteraceae bacterium]|nr:hypothetical protein [Solirubrobacteraceae bacterium]